MALATIWSASESEAENQYFRYGDICVPFTEYGWWKDYIIDFSFVGFDIFLELGLRVDSKEWSFLIGLSRFDLEVPCSMKEHELWIMRYEMHENLKFIKPD